jgi:stage II sporulation protein D
MPWSPSFWLVFFLGFFSFTVCANTPKVQVLVAKSLSNIKISGHDIIKSYKHRPFTKKYSGQQTLTLDCQKKLNSSLWKQGPLFASLSNKEGILEWKKNRYQGEFFVVRSENKKGCDLVHEVSIDDYISTLVAKEMHRDWPLEALKAQAVAARTYALFKQKERKFNDDSGQYFDLENSEKDQVSGSLEDVNANTHRASFLTQGEVLLNDKAQLAPAFYHSKCGGQTHLPEQVWGNKVSGYKPVTCPFCKNMGQPTWNTTVSFNKLALVMLTLAWPNHPYKGFAFSPSHFVLYESDKDNQTLSFSFKNKIFNIKKAQLRKMLGRQQIQSNNFTIESKGSLAKVEGDGLGHGVGLCQIGALELAKRGYNYRQILSFYYPDFQLKNYY